MKAGECHQQPAALELREALQPALNALGELAGGLAGEGEPEHLVAAHEPFATSQTHAAAIVSVLPLPAPATTSAGASGASMTAVCSSVGGNWPSAAAIAAAERAFGWSRLLRSRRAHRADRYGCGTGRTSARPGSDPRTAP